MENILENSCDLKKFERYRIESMINSSHTVINSI